MLTRLTMISAGYANRNRGGASDPVNAGVDRYKILAASDGVGLIETAIVQRMGVGNHGDVTRRTAAGSSMNRFDLAGRARNTGAVVAHGGCIKSHWGR